MNDEKLDCVVCGYTFDKTDFDYGYVFETGRCSSCLVENIDIEEVE